MGKLKIDLHPVYNQTEQIDELLRNAFATAKQEKLKSIEIIHGKGSGQLKKRVLRFLQRSENKEMYARIDKDSKNFGRTFVYFKHET